MAPKVASTTEASYDPHAVCLKFTAEGVVALNVTSDPETIEILNLLRLAGIERLVSKKPRCGYTLEPYVSDFYTSMKWEGETLICDVDDIPPEYT